MLRGRDAHDRDARYRDAHDRDARYRALYEENFRLVLGYALRRTASADDAADVAAECMLIAWRRLSDVPAGAEARLWLYGVARRVLANHHRGAERRDRLGSRLGEQLRWHLPVDPTERRRREGPSAPRWRGFLPPTGS